MTWTNRRLPTRVLCTAIVLFTPASLSLIGGHTAQASPGCDCTKEQDDYNDAVAEELDASREYFEAQRQLDEAWRDLKTKQGILNHYSRSRGAKMGNLYKGASMPTVFSNALVARMPHEQYRRAVAIGQEEASDLDSA